MSKFVYHDVMNITQKDIRSDTNIEPGVIIEFQDFQNIKFTRVTTVLGTVCYNNKKIKQLITTYDLGGGILNSDVIIRKIYDGMDHN